MRATKTFIEKISICTAICAVLFSGSGNVLAQNVCQIQGAPVMQTGALTAADATQAGRVVRGGIPSTCVGKSNTLQNTTAVNQDNYTYASPVTGCATVEFNATACGGATTQAVAYFYVQSRGSGNQRDRRFRL